MSDLEKFARIYRDIDRMSGVVDALAAREFAAMRTGSGAPTLSAAESVLYWDTANDALYANADGATSWVFLAGTAGAGAHLMFSASHPDSVPQVAVVGGMMYGNGTPAWDVLAHPGTAGHALVSGTATQQWDGTPDWTGRHRFGEGLTITGGVADLDGRDLIIDTDGDTYLDSPSDDRARFVIPDGGRFDIIIDGQDIFYFNQTALTLQTDLWIAATGKGFVHTDGVTAGLVFVADGTRFLPVAVSGDLTLAATGAAEVVAIWGYAVQDHAPEDGEALIWNTGNSRYEPSEASGGIDLTPTEGAIIYGDSGPAWAVLAHPGSAYRHLETTAAGLGWVTSITLVDEAWVGMGVSSGRLEFEGTPTPDEVSIEDANFAVRSQNVGIGPSISVSSDVGVWIERSFVALDLNAYYGLYSRTAGSPASGFDSSIRGVQGEARLTTAQVQGGSALPYMGVMGVARISNAVAGTLQDAHGGDFHVDAEDGTIVSGVGVRVETPWIDTGTVTSGFGVKIEEGTVGGSATYTTQYGLHIDPMAEAATNWAVYTVAPTKSYFGGVIIASAGIRLPMDTTNVTDDGPTDSELDSIFGTPATVGAGFMAFVLDESVRLFGCASTGSEWYWQRWFLTA